MAVNSEGIHASRPWKIYGEGPSTKVKIDTGSFNEDKQKDLTAEDIRFTAKNSTLYAFAMGWPDKAVVVNALGLDSAQNPGKIGSVELLGWKGDLKWKQDESSLRVEVPAEKISELAIAMKIEFV
jgi:alpha-L-fucosidase